MKAWEHVTHISDVEKALLARHLRINPSEVQGPLTGSLVTWDCGTGFPLYPWPANKAGGRLHRLSKLSMGMFLGRIQRHSLFRGGADASLGRTKAQELSLEFPPGRRVVLVGQLVAVAFGFGKFWDMEERGDVYYTTIPEPKDVMMTQHPGNEAATCAAVQWAANHMVGMSNAKR